VVQGPRHHHERVEEDREILTRYRIDARGSNRRASLSAR